MKKQTYICCQPTTIATDDITPTLLGIGTGHVAPAFSRTHIRMDGWNGWAAKQEHFVLGEC